MKYLIKSEMWRYRRWAVGLMIVHLAFWAIVWNLQTGPGSQPKLAAVPGAILTLALVAILTGLAFGVIQMGLHKRINHWTWLIQRPLHPNKIYVSLVAASALLMALVFMVPWLAYIFALDIMTNAVIDPRHYLNGCYFFFLGFSSYLTGCVGMLSPKKALFLVGSMVLFVFGHALGFFDHAPSPMYLFFLTAFLVSLWLLALGRYLFKPDLHLFPSSRVNLVMTAIPIQFSISFVLLLAVNILYLAKLHFSNPNPHQTPPEGTLKYTELLDERASAEWFLRDLEGPEAGYLRNQVRLGDVDYTSALPLGYPIRHQMLFQDRNYKAMVDWAGETYWVFSHSQMLLKGFDLKTHKTTGWLGLSGFREKKTDFSTRERFPAVPQFSRDNQLQLPQKILQIDFENRKVVEKHALTGSEVYYSKIYLNPNYLSVCSDKNLYIFENKNHQTKGDRLEPDYVVPHPRPIGRLSHIVTYRLIDGYLAKYGNDYFYGADRPGTLLLRLKKNEAPKVVYQKEYRQFVDPAYIRYGTFSLSPLAFILHDNVFWRLVEPNERRHIRFLLTEMRVPTSLIWTLVSIHLLCIVAAWFACRRARLDSGGKAMWLILVGLFGLPGLVTLFLLRERPDGLA